MSHIFISYSRKDKHCAYKIQRQLEARGFKVWIDKKDIEAGAAFPIEILRAIREAAAVLILWSESAASSHFVGEEIEEALNQKMMRSIPVIPVWLDSTERKPELAHLNDLNMYGCTDEAMDSLINKIPSVIHQTLGRQWQGFDINQLLNQHPNKTTIAGTELVSVPFLTSWYCSAFIVAQGTTVIANHLSTADAKPFICVVPQFLGDTSDATLAQVFNSIQTQLDGQTFVGLHVKPNQSGKIIIDVAERGQALDAVQTTYEAVFNLVGRNRSLATLKIFTPMMAAMSGSIGHVFDSFWHVQEYHFDRQNGRYDLLFDSKDL